MDKKKLCDAAIDAMKNSYSPYSGFCVGASLLTVSGKIYTGCNIENSAYTPSVCAERVALFKAVSEGEHRFAALAVCGGKHGVIQGNCPPCGVCRQVLREFCEDDMPILIVTDDNGYTEKTLGELLPFSFNSEFLK